ncbi:MAG TPA: GNAT family N-acetyltransferase [Conexibacter sp.]
MSFVCEIRPATRADAPLLIELIGALADYERLRDQVVLDAALLERHLFGARPAAEAVIAQTGGDAVGYALFFSTFSTFLGRPGIWLEDLFVLPERRRGGVGRALLEHVAQLAVARGCGRLEWSALDWNEPALAFYRGLGARVLPEWRLHRLDGAALAAVARSHA